MQTSVEKYSRFQRRFNKSVQIEIHFENKYFKYIDGMLFVDGDVICKVSGVYAVKSCWGSGHAKAIADYYDNDTNFNLADVKDTMDAMFGIYKSAEQNGVSVCV